MKVILFSRINHYIRKATFFIISFFLINLLFNEVIIAQSKNNPNSKIKSWSTANPFKTDVFVKNYGQFDKWVQSKETIEYAINSDEKIFFTKHGLIYKLNTTIIDGEKSIGESETNNPEENEKRFKKVSYFVTMEWEGCNKNVVIEASHEADGYYTYGENGYENIKAKGFKKITYKNLYPGIDVEYTFPDNKSGIKYQLIVQQSTDISVVKMHYSGNVNEIVKDSEGNILIKTPAGNITDHAPLSFYKENNTDVPSSFWIIDNTVGFSIKEIQTPNTKTQTLIIDPWTTVPSTLTTDNSAFDVDCDDFGNVYFSGGTEPFKLAKYSPSGTPIWTYTNPPGWGATCYSKFCILPHSGTTFIGEGFTSIGGPRVSKLNSSGNVVFTSPPMVGSNEIWMMFYNRCTGQIIGFGGGTDSQNNLHLISDTNLTTFSVNNFNGYSGSCCNDITSAEMDYNGDIYALMSSFGGTPSVNNHLQKSLLSTGYLPPCAFDVPTTYNYAECDNFGIPGLALYDVTVRANALALNTSYLFSYDGDSLIAFNKTNGSMLAFIVVDPAYAGGQFRTHEGIAVDDCNNVYVGGTNKVHVYKFNGTAFIAQAPITSNINNEVYDIALDQASGMLYVSGLGFVTTLQQAACATNQLTLSIINDCSSNVSVSVSGGTPPYSYLWSNGATTSGITGPMGVYTVTVTDNSCKVLKGVDTTSICFLTIPNVFTPNGDNQNDVFDILYDGNEPYLLNIYNRWGLLLFTSKDKNIHWDGKTSSKKDASDGVYYYILAIGDKSYNGTVTLIR